MRHGGLQAPDARKSYALDALPTPFTPPNPPIGRSLGGRASGARLQPERQTGPFDEARSIADYLQLLRRWRWLALAVLALTVVGAAIWTVAQPKQYQSEATILIRTDSSVQLFPLSANDRLTRIMSAERDFLESTEFVEAAQAEAGNSDPVAVDIGDIDARVTPSLISFTATSPSAERAAATAQTWAQTYIGVRHDADVSETERSIATLEATAATLITERDRISAPLSSIDEQIEVAEDGDAIDRLAAERLASLQALAPQLQPIDAQIGEVNAELGEQRLLEDFLENPNVSARVNRFAEAPVQAASPSIPQNLALGVIAGALLAMSAVLAAASFDDKVRSTDDVEELLGIGPLASLPVDASIGKPIGLEKGSPTAESFQRLISAIDFTRAAGYNNKVLLVTSPEKSEGKTTLSARLALALASEGRHVLLIGGDLRRPALSKAFEATASPGLTDFLAGSAGLEQCIHPISNTLAILPAGQNQSQRNPAEILRSDQLLVAVDKLRDHCDHIIIDAPPLLAVVDTLELAESADGVILCTYARRTRKRALSEAHRMLIESNAPHILGFVMSGASETASYTYQ